MLPEFIGAGAVCPAGVAGPFSRIEWGARLQPAMIDIRSDVAKKSVARTAVARDSAFAWPRPVMKLPVPPPAPSAPPSERCSRTTATRAITMRIWMTISTDCMEGLERTDSRAWEGQRPQRWRAPIMAQGAKSIGGDLGIFL